MTPSQFRKQQRSRLQTVYPVHPCSFSALLKYFMRKLFQIIFASILGVTANMATATDVGKPRNLLIVTADDMNADSGGWNGSTLGATPNLDAFAKSAHRFVNSHVTVPICQPGRSALMTGRVPHRNGALGFNPIRRDVPTIVELLRERGYYTGVIAKAVHMAPADKFPWHSIGDQVLGKQPTKFAEKFRELLANATDQKKPFFINANICDPHRPFISGTGISGSNNRRLKRDEPLDGARIFLPNEVAVPAFLEDIPRVREEVAQYYSTVSRFDVAFGLMMKELIAVGRDKDTIVVFMSDHGMSFPFSKATVYRNGTWSPVLIRIPGMKEPQTRTEYVSSVDVMPSLLELLRVQPPADMDGRSWVPLLNGQSQADRDFVVTHVNTVSSGKSLAQRCIRTNDRALMFHAWVGGSNPFKVEAMSGLSFAAMNASTDPSIQSRVKQLIDGEMLMLFDITADPTERHNVIRDPKYANNFTELSRKLLAHMRQTNDPQLAALEAALTQK
jgi:N-sulfoglucosamine sulfohydrolase